MIVIEFSADRQCHCPAFVCDVCNLRIEEAKDGHVVHPPANLDRARGTAFTVHKACDLPIGGPRLSWIPLGAFLVYLSHSVSLPWGDAGAADAARRFAEA